MKKIVVVLILVLLLAGAAYRGLQVSFFPIGGGQEKTSPDGKYVASAMDYYDESFWGAERSWYEFTIQPKGSDRVLKVKQIDCPPGSILFSMRSDELSIEWSEDSRSVTFKFPGTELTLER